MKTTLINSLEQLRTKLPTKGRAYLLLYKKGSEVSDCALKNLNRTETEENQLEVMVADVAMVKDIHPEYGVKTVPSLLEFENGTYRNIYKGCHQPEVFGAIFDEAVYQAKMAAEGKIAKQVRVYSTPSCSWCTTLKSYLNKNKIRYQDVDISRDERAAQDLKNQTGQQGVPQTEINGQWVVGFDQKRLNELLEIN